MNRRSGGLRPAPRRKRNLLGWLLGGRDEADLPRAASESVGDVTPPRPAQASPDDENDPSTRASRLGLAQHDAARPEEDRRPTVPAATLWINVSLPANLDVGDDKPLPVRITTIGGS